MENVVGVVRGTDKIAAFRELLRLTGFEAVLLRRCEEAAKANEQLKVAIKPNLMVFVNSKGHEAVVTDRELVECLVDHILGLGFRDVSVCEAQNDVGRMLKNHNVSFVARQLGFQPGGRYRIVDLTLESEPCGYRYRDASGRMRIWKDRVGRSWREADFRITFAKCKTHEHDWMTLGVKNVYGCFPRPDKVARYHIREEVPDVTARSLLNFPVHFSFVDGWIASDGFQGYKIPHPKELRMLFGGNDAVAVDMEIFRRAGLDPRKSHMLARAVEQLHGGAYPGYVVKGDQRTMLKDLAPWENISDRTVEAIDVLEEIYIAWGIINLEPAAVQIDYRMFPPRNLLYRIAVWFMKQLYSVFKVRRWIRRHMR